MSAAVILVLAVTFAAAAVHKLRDRQPFVATLDALVPGRLARPLSLAVPAGELLLAGALIAGVLPQLVTLLAIAALAAFSVALVRLRAAARGRAVIPCNCFGAAGGGDPAIGLVRNGLLMALGAAALVRPVGGPLWDLPPAELAGAATVALGLLCCWQLGVALLVPVLRGQEAGT